DLARLVADGSFRSDLFYRLHVFPVRLPPLRERREDLPTLVRHFARTFARRAGQVIDILPAEAMAALQNYDWPGNVRDLEHLVERAVILSPGPVLRVPMGDLLVSPASAGTPTPVAGSTLRDAERALIHRTLVECRWVVGGRNG